MRIQTNRFRGADVSIPGIKFIGLIQSKDLETGRRTAPWYMQLEVHLKNLLENSWGTEGNVQEGKDG